MPKSAVTKGLSAGSVLQVKPCQFEVTPGVVNVTGDAPGVGDGSALGIDIGGVVALG